MHSTASTSRNQAASLVPSLSASRQAPPTPSALIEAFVQERTATLHAANQELESFVSSVSHELRGPLHVINGFAKLLLQNCAHELSPRAEGYLKRILAAERRMASLIDALLMLSRLECAHIGGDEIDLYDLVMTVVGDLTPREQHRRIEVRVELLPLIRADPVLMRQVFENLLANALKYTRGRAVARVHVGHYREDGQLVFFVRDNGVGFDMVHADKMFGLFERLHSAGEFEGTGVGLALVRRIVDRHGGRVWAEGEQGAGATLYVAIPQDRHVRAHPATTAPFG